MAAGLGFKDFTSGEVLTAADVDGYLMQGVLVFASTAARDAAITAPAEGQFCFTKDTNTTFFYDGATWVVSGATGDIEGVTAGTGISGGGTSGTVTVTNSMATAIDAKGDLIAGTGADTFSRLAVGTNGQVLTCDSNETTGLKFATPAAGGFVGVSLYITSSTTIANNTFTTLTYASEEFDTDAFHDNSTNTDRITIPAGKAGKYLITAKIDIDAATASSRRDLYILQYNSSDVFVRDKFMRTASVTGTPIACLQSTVFDAAVGDYFITQCYQNSGGNMAIENKMFQATYLGA